MIGEKLRLFRDTLYNRTNFFEDYIDMCEYELELSIPEDSLSPEKQQELLQFIEDSTRFFGCQFIIATHSPFLLSLWGAKIYDMDEESVDVKRRTELSNVRVYYDFFKKHEREFK